MNIYDNILSGKKSMAKAMELSRILNHKLRLQILQVLQEKGRLTVTELYVILRLDQSTCSQHLARLRKARIIKGIRDNKFVYYSIDERSAMKVIKAFADFNTEIGDISLPEEVEESETGDAIAVD